MAPPSTVAAILEIVDISADKQKEAETHLSAFLALSEEDKKVALPKTIQTVFPIIFGDIAEVEGSANFKELKFSLWQVA